MSINRNFSASLLLSLLWHFFCISIVSIELVPERKTLAKFADISFLGPILGKEVLVSLGSLEKQRPGPTAESDNKSFWVKKETSPCEETSTKAKISAKKFFRDLASGSNEDKIAPGLSKIIFESKAIPIFSLSLGKSPVRIYEPYLEGPIRSRGIIYKPPLPRFKEWAGGPDQYSDVELKFLVSPEGKVLYVEKILSSGDPKMDLLWMRYVKRWQFIPEQTSKNQWGKIRLNFEGE